jgi:hypothetical protein
MSGGSRNFTRITLLMDEQETGQISVVAFERVVGELLLSRSDYEANARMRVYGVYAGRVAFVGNDVHQRMRNRARTRAA